MADNTTLNTGSGGDTLATDDIAGVKYPRSKLVIGADGTNDGDVSATNPLPVKGTGTAGTANAGVVTIQGIASMTPVQIADNSGAITVDWAGTAPPIGAGVEATALRVTLATDSTGVVSIDDNGGSLTVDAPVATPVFVRLSDGTSAITTLPVSLASVPSHAVTGPLTDSELRASAVPVSVATIPSHAVTNAGTFAVQVDGSALTALQLIDNLVLAEDAGHVSADPGVQMLAVRNDSDASLCGTTLDYTPLQVDSNGYLKVNIKAGAGSGGTASTDDAAFTAASGSGTPMMGFVTADAVDSGDVGVVGMLANRQLKVTLYDSGGIEASVGGGTQYDEDTVHVSGDKLNMAGVVRTDSLTALAADGDRTVLQVNSAGRLYAALGTEYVEDAATPATITGHAVMMERDDALSATPIEGDWLALKCNANGALWAAIDGTVTVGSHAVTNAGTFAVQASQTGTWDIGTVTAVTTVSTVTTCSTVTTVATLTGSGVAHDGADSGNPHKIGAKATTSLSGLTLVANADRTDLFAGVDGVQITRPHCNLEDIVTATPVAITDGTSTSVISAQGAGIKVYIVEVIIANSSASNVTVDLRDGTAGAVKATFPVPANGGVVKTLATPLPFTANTAVAADPSAAASTITVTLIGFKSKV